MNTVSASRGWRDVQPGRLAIFAATVAVATVVVIAAIRVREQAAVAVTGGPRPALCGPCLSGCPEPGRTAKRFARRAIGARPGLKFPANKNGAKIVYVGQRRPSHDPIAEGPKEAVAVIVR